MDFENPLLLLGLLLVPLLALLEWQAAARTEVVLRSLVGRRPDHPLLQQRVPTQPLAGSIVRLAALVLLIVGAAGPRWGREAVRRASQGSDVVFLIDVSASMDARDVAPSRLEEARREALALADRLGGSRIGVIAFAGDAVRLCPLTLDQAAVRLTLGSLDSRTVSEPGSDLGRALQMAMKLMPKGRRDEQALVLWSDGEDLEGRATEALKALRDAGVRVFTVGVGTAQGDAIPVLDEQGRAIDIKKDEAGVAVHSRLDERLLREMARSTRGSYFRGDRAGGELPRLVAALGGLSRGDRGARLVERPIARFGWFAALAGVAMMLELLRARRRLTSTAALAAGRGTVRAAAAAWFAIMVGAAPAAAQSTWARADAAFRAGRWAEAESLYARRAGRRGADEVRTNLATARARLGKGEEAARDLSRLAGRDTRAGRAAGYNLGTLQAEQQDYDRALGELRRAIERDPEDADARWNYELARRLREQRQQQQQQRSGTPPPTPEPQPGGASGPQGGQPQPPPQAGAGAPPTPQAVPPRGAQPQAGPGGSGRMSREQAEQLLGSLQELERLERRRRERSTAGAVRGGKDW